MDARNIVFVVIASCLLIATLVTAECNIARYNQQKLPCHTHYRKDECEALKNWYHCLNETFKHCDKVTYVNTREYVENALVEAHKTCDSCTVFGEVALIASCLAGLFMLKKHV